MSDIVDRLLAAARHPYMDNTCKVRTYDALEPSDEVLKELYRLRAENAKLRAALKPFAEYEFDDFDDDEDETASPFILVKHLRAAGAALKEAGE